MTDADDSDPHESFADPAACGLAAVLLLLFSTITATGPAHGTLPAQMQLAVVFTFPTNSPPADACNAQANLDDRAICKLRNGTLYPNKELFTPDPARPDANMPRDLFLDQSALFGTPTGQRPAITLIADRLRGAPSNPMPLTRWATRLSIQFAKQPRTVELVWEFGQGIVVESVYAELVPATLKSTDAPPLTDEKKLPAGSKGVLVRAATASLILEPR